jgi:putative hydrolase of the HAD superfamily
MAIEGLLLDVGGVIGTNGWDRHARKRAAEKFGLDAGDTDSRHKMVFDTYEEGKLTLDDYLDRVIFHKPRDFSREDFTSFMYSVSEPWPDMIALVKRLKEKYQLHITICSNEGRELTLHRVELFGLKTFVDTFVFSCFVRTRKPDPDIYQIALDLSLRTADQMIYLDDRALFVELAAKQGIRGIVHSEYEKTRAELAGFGLSD